MNDITSEPIYSLKDKLQKREVSSREVTEAFLNKIKSKTDLNAFLTICEKEAFEAADRADTAIKEGRSGALLGIPVGVKDVILTKDILSTSGSKILGNFVPPYDATCVSKLKDAGAVIMGKLNMDEFAMGSSNENSSFGPVKNPWDKSRVPGGSSGGSAAAVAARMVPTALGTDTGGSIRQPAAFCNLVGLKPTYGRVSRYGVIAFASSLDQVGVFTHNVKDCALVSKVISGFDPKDSTSMNRDDLDYSAKIGQSIKGLRLGVPKEYFIKGLDSEVEDSVRAALKKMIDLGAEVVDISLPHTEAAVAVYYIIAPAEASSNLARYDGIRYGYRAGNTKSLSDLYSKTRSEGFGDEVKRRIIIGTYVLSSGYYDAYYSRAQKVRTLIIKDFNDAFSSKCDVIVCPTTPTGPFKIADESKQDPLAMYLNDVFTIPVNLAGLPGISIPCGVDRNNLPVGIQLIGKAWDEATLFQVASAYESATDWHKKAPKE